MTTTRQMPKKPRAPRKARVKKTWAEKERLKRARAERPNQVPVRKVTVSKNEDLGGIEIRFPEDAKPDAVVRQWMKEKGLKWSAFNVLWWAKWDEELYKELIEILTDEGGG